MPALLDLLNTYVFVGIPANAAWDLIKYTWQTMTKTTWEDLYVWSVREAIEELRPMLNRHLKDGELFLDEISLREMLQRKVPTTVKPAALPLAPFADAPHMAHLAHLLAEHDLITLGGSPLHESDVEQLLRTLVGRVRAHLFAAVSGNDETFRAVMLEHAAASHVRFRDVDQALTQIGAQMHELRAQIEKLTAPRETLASQEDTYSLGAEPEGTEFWYRCL